MVMQFIRALVALAVLMASASALAADAGQLASFQPFTQFARGEGEGYAYSYTNRSKDELVAILRNQALASVEMRVSCAVIVRQMAEAHPSLPFEGCEGAAAAIEADPAFEVAVCNARSELAVTDEQATAFGTWQRDCLPGEQVLMYKGEVILSLMCLNPVIATAVPLRQAAPAPAPEPVWRAATPDAPPPSATDLACPMITTVRIYDNRALDVLAAGNAIGGLYDHEGKRMFPKGNISVLDGDGSEPDRISRAFGPLFDQAYQKGLIGLSTKSHELVVELVRGGQAVELFSGTVTGEMVVSIPDYFQAGDKIVTRFRDYSRLASPSKISGVHSWYEEFGVCNTNTQSMIEL